MMVEIVICDWKEIQVRDLARITYESRQASKLEATSVEAIGNFLQTMQDRFPAEALFIAYLDGKMVGWAGIERESSTSGEIGRWHPYVLPIQNQDDIAMQLVEGMMNYARKSGMNRVEISFGDVTEETAGAYETYSKWYSKYNVTKYYDTAYMIFDINDPLHKPSDLPDSTTIKKLADVEIEELYQCYYETFSTGQDRDFFDHDDSQRRAGFDRSFVNADNINNEISSALMVDDKLAGFALIRSRDNEEHLDMFGIHSDYRRRGLGKLLILDVMNRVAKLDVDIMSIGVDSINSNAYDLYKKVGFKTVTRIIVHSWKDEEKK
ncbi:MAG: GNAT family N-acetyltransferase [Candidatus Thorarchaeota archaeon]